jgi:hypothetical protein
MVVVVLVLFGGSIVDAVAGAAVEGAQVEQPAAAVGPKVEAGMHLVQPGQTYWSIAEALPGSDDIRARVDALQVANHGRILRSGDRLVVPALE